MNHLFYLRHLHALSPVQGEAELKGDRDEQDRQGPYDVKMAELRRADPYGTRREGWVTWRHEFRCGHNCYCNYGWYEQQKSKDRRARKAAARDWEKEY